MDSTLPKPWPSFLAKNKLTNADLAPWLEKFKKFDRDDHERFHGNVSKVLDEILKSSNNLTPKAAIKKLHCLSDVQWEGIDKRLT